MSDFDIKERLRRLEEKSMKFEKENKKLREKVERLEGEDKSIQESFEQDISRRSFLKKLGAGAIGLGVLSFSPATSQLKLTKNGIKNSNSLFTGYAEVNEHTNIECNLDSDQSMSSGVWETVNYTVNAKDRLNEWDDTNNDFTPEKSGEYRIDVSLCPDGGTNEGDWMFAFYNKTDNNYLFVNENHNEHVNANRNLFHSSFVLELESGKSYEVRAQSQNNSNNLNSSSVRTKLRIKREIVQ